MTLMLESLDDVTRSYMKAELLADLRTGSLHRSPRLTSMGWQAYKHLLIEAVERHSADWLAGRLALGRCLRKREPCGARRPRTGTCAVPSNASQVLAEGVFNRYYIRAVCLRRLREGRPQVQVYRARESTVPRPRSIDLEGRWMDAAKLLEDLRRPPAEFAETGLPPGPGSGLSVR